MEKESQLKEIDADAKDLKDAVNESSKYNRTLLISFLLFVVYVLITVASTTDLQLLIPDSKVKLPVINVDLPLFSFYIVAPLLVVVLHYNLLFNLLQHRKKLSEWEDKKEDKDILQLSPFLINYTIQYKTPNINYYLLKTFIWFSTYFMPLSVLLFTQWIFSKYHSFFMTSWHLSIVLIDAFLIFLFWHRINNEEMMEEKYDSFINILRFYLTKKGFLKFIKRLPLIFLLISLSLTNFIIVVLLTKSDTSYLRLRSIKYSQFGFLIPYLNFIEKTLVESPPSDEIVQRYIAMGKTKDDAWLDFASGLNLQKRDLKLANFYGSNLLKADLRSAQMQGADLGMTQMQGANLRYAQLQGVNLIEAQLQGADLMYAKLQGADLMYAKLQGANLGSAQLQGANLGSAQLQGADLIEAQLQGADLGSAQLQGAILEGAELFGADLTKANIDKLFFVHIEIKAEVNWDELLNYKKGLLLENEREVFILRIKEAEERYKTIKNRFEANLKSDYEGFIQERQQLSCKDFYIAKGMLKQHFSLDDESSKRYNGVIIEYMKSNCPDILEKVKADKNGYKYSERIGRKIG